MNDSEQKYPLGVAIIKALEIENVSFIFGLVGSHILDPYNALIGSSIQSITAKHEANASFMAEAYGRLTGNPGVTMVTAGPGSLNGMNGLGQAQYSSSPLVHICGAVPTNALVHELHATNQSDYTASCAAPLCKSVFRPLNKEEVLPLLSEAFSIARTYPQGPVHFEIPLDLFESNEDITFDYTPSSPDTHITDDHLSSKLIKELVNSKKAIFVLDKGSVRQKANKACIDAARTVGAKIITMRDAIGAIASSEPDYLGVLDTFYSGDIAQKVLAEADCVIAIGFEKDSYAKDLLEKSTNGTIIEVGTTTVQLNESREIINKTLEINSIMQNVLQAVDFNDHRQNGWDDCELSKLSYEVFRKANYQQAKLLKSPGSLLFSDAIIEVENLIDENCIVTQDVGAHEIWARAILPIYNETTQLSSSTWASMGFALPAAIAARCAEPEKRIYTIIGDGCLLMSMNDLVTVAEVGGPTIIVVSNDSEYSLISKVQLDRHDRTSETDIKSIDYSRIAGAVGIKSQRVTTHLQLYTALEFAKVSDEPFLIDVVCKPCPVYPKFEVVDK